MDQGLMSLDGYLGWGIARIDHGETGNMGMVGMGVVCRGVGPSIL